MTVVVITSPDVPLVSLADAKAHLRVLHDDDDAYIEALVMVAADWLDGPDGWLGRALRPQVLELRQCGFTGEPVALPQPPCVSVTSVTYLDPAGDDQVWSAESWRTTQMGALTYLIPARSLAWPSVLGDVDAVRIRYAAGYGAEDGPALPAPIRQAVLLLVGHWYANRAPVSAEAVNDLPFAVEALLSTYRVWN